MTTALLNPKIQFLLGAGLNILHFESQEWMETIGFWKDEIKFFDNLLNKKESQKNTSSEYVHMLKNLDKIHADIFEDLENTIVNHERLLARIIQGENGLADDDYREKHLQIKLRMNTFTEEFNLFKKIIFRYAKSL